MGQHTGSSTSPHRIESWISTALTLGAIVCMFVGIHWLLGPTAEERAAARKWQLQHEQEEFDSYERAYVAKCTSYPSSECSALINYDEDSSPCFVGQVKANRRSGVYHTPKSSWYGRTHADVLCFKSADLAIQAGYRPARATGN